MPLQFIIEAAHFLSVFYFVPSRGSVI